jgi:hypothetical protein
MSGVKTVIFESSKNLSTLGAGSASSAAFKVGPSQNFYGTTGVTISVVGQTEFTLTTGTITSVDISGVLTPKSYTNIIDVPKISKVSVGTYVTSIGDNAFNSVTSLTTVTFAQGSQIGSIGENAFQNATNLTSLTVPAPVTIIGDYAFYGANKLNSITFESGSKLLSIGVNAFFNATSLTSITIPASVTNIGNRAFEGSGLKTVVFDSLTNFTSLGNSNGFKYGTGQTFFGANNVDVSVVYSPNAKDTKYYYPVPTVSHLPIEIDTKGYNRCDVLVVGGGGQAGDSSDGSGYFFGFGGTGGGGGSASFTNILCNPIDGNIKFNIHQVTAQSVLNWELNTWTQNGSSLGDCTLQAQNGRDGSNSIQYDWGWLYGAGGQGGIPTGNMGLLSSSVTLTANRGNAGYRVGISVPSSSLPAIPDHSRLVGGAPGNILSSFKAPTDKKYGQGSKNKAFLKAKINNGNDTYRYVNVPGDPPGAAYIQVNRYNVP